MRRINVSYTINPWEKYSEFIDFVEKENQIPMIENTLKKLNQIGNNCHFERAKRFANVQLRDKFSKDSTILTLSDPKGRVVFCNSNFYELCGSKSQERLIQSYIEIRHPDMPETVFLDLWATITNKDKWAGVICNKGIDGLDFWQMINIFPIIKDEKIIAFFSIGKKAPDSLVEEAIQVYRKIP